MKMYLANAMGSIDVEERDMLLGSKLLQVHPLNDNEAALFLVDTPPSLIKEELRGHVFKLWNLTLSV